MAPRGPFDITAELLAYTDANADLLDADEDFANWLARDHRPIGGGWQY